MWIGPQGVWGLLEALSGVRTGEVCTFDLLGRSSDKKWILISCIFKLRCWAYASTEHFCVTVFLKTLAGSAVQTRCRTTSRRHICLSLWLAAVISFCLTHSAPATTVFFLFPKHTLALHESLYICCLYCAQVLCALLSARLYVIRASAQTRRASCSSKCRYHHSRSHLPVLIL